MGPKFIAGMGRVCISAIFILLGVAAIFRWDMAQTDLGTALSNWKVYVGHTDFLGEFIDFLLSIVPVLVVLGILLQVIGGLLVFFSFQVRWGAFLLIVYLICMTVTHHYFWFLKGSAMSRSLVLFLKNVSIMGGLWVVLAMGAGKNYVGSSGNVRKND